ncbi:ParB/RepB/Spo0J family partition protein [bacterium]|nr:ParB/RepB/Spo0J family partition protein [bacterium]
MSKTPLGRGLGALLGGSKPSSAKPQQPKPAEEPISYPPLRTENALKDTELSPRHLPVEDIRPCPFQPRRHFDESALEELADSIREQGLIQPLVVRKKPDHWELIAGERRWRASQKAGLKEVPIIIREADDREVLELALIENLQRENLNPIEEALGYRQLIQQFQLKQEEAAIKVGKSRAAVANALRLLKLPDDVQHDLRDAKLSVGHAKVLLGLGKEEEKIQISRRIIKDGLSVRQTEALISELHQKQKNKQLSTTHPITRNNEKDVHVAHMEQRLVEKFNTKVRLKYQEGKGALEIRFFSDEELESLLSNLGVSAD